MNASAIALLTILLFLFFNAFSTQKIYHSRYTVGFSLLMLTAVVVTYFFQPYSEGRPVLWKVLALLFFYSLLLALIKKFYRSVNNFLIRRHFVSSRFTNKCFTFIHFPFEYGDDYWDEKRASKPSWFDYLLTYALFFVPLSLTAAIT